MRYLIIGIDPGNTIGLAAVDFEGKLVEASHLQNGGVEGAVSLVERWGTPSVIACDVKPAPEFVLKMASYFNVRMFVPSRTWREDEKKEILKNVRIRNDENTGGRIRNDDFKIGENTHERDAISAAVGAWRENQNLLRSARVANVKAGTKEKLCHLLLQGYRLNIAEQMLTEKENIGEEMEGQRLHEEIEASGMGRSSKQNEKIISELHLQARTLERTNVELRKRVQLLEQEREGLLHSLKMAQRGTMDRMMQDNEFRNMRAKISKLEERVAHYSKLLYQLTVALRKKKGKETNIGHKETEHKKQDKTAENNDNKKAKDSSENLKGLETSDMLEQMVNEYRKSRLDEG